MTRTVRSPLLELLLVLMVLVCGGNYSLMKRAFQDVPPLAFNAIRMTIASVVLLAAIRVFRRGAMRLPDDIRSVFHTPNPLSSRDRWDLLWLGLVGHLGYQLCFALGVARTHASNAALIVGAAPVAVAALSPVLGRGHVGRLQWLGAAVSGLGVYLVVGGSASFGGATLNGDLLMCGALVCWAVYTLGSARIMTFHSPLYVTGVTFAIGTACYALCAVPSLLEVRWTSVAATIWAMLVLSALLALCFGYIVWNAAVQRLGASHTAIYSNLVPVAAMVVAALWLGEPISAAKGAAAVLILAGVALTRMQGRESEPG